jgi:hypothetical protein
MLIFIRVNVTPVDDVVKEKVEKGKIEKFHCYAASKYQKTIGR